MSCHKVTMPNPALRRPRSAPLRSPLTCVLTLAGLLSGTFLSSHALADELWSSHGPEGGMITQVQVDPRGSNIAYACTAGAGLFASTNGGSHWRHVDSLITNGTCWVAIDPRSSSVLFAAADSGPQRSVDGGATWTAAGGPLPLYTNVVAIDPLVPGRIYALAPSRSIFRSTDNGQTWAAANNGLDLYHVLAITFDPKNAGVVYVGGQGGVFKSADGGATWSWTGTGLSATTLAVDPDDSSRLFGGGPDGIFVSTDAGTTWSLLRTSIYNVRQFAFGPARSTVYAAAGQVNYSISTPAGVFKSTDGGFTWAPANVGLLDQGVASVSAGVTSPAPLLAGTDTGGVFSSLDQASSWVASNGGLTAAPTFCVAVTAGAVPSEYVGSILMRAFESADGGTTWHVDEIAAPPSDLSRSAVFSLAADPSARTILYAGTGSGLFKTTDGGLSWGSVNNGLSYGDDIISSLAIDPKNPQTVLAGTRGLFKSTDGGGSWRSISAGLRDGYASAVAIDPQDTDVLYTSVAFGISKSTNGGATWVELSTALPPPSCTSITIDPTNHQVIYCTRYGSGVFKSPDGGMSWSLVGQKQFFGSNAILAVDPLRPSVLFASDGSPDGGVVMSSDGGADWSRIGGPPRTVSLAVDNARRLLFVASPNSGAWTLTLPVPRSAIIPSLPNPAIPRAVSPRK
jgi:photosystem II stability/assembly factor-like uncharacterized protein